MFPQEGAHSCTAATNQAQACVLLFLLYILILLDHGIVSLIDSVGRALER